MTMAATPQVKPKRIEIDVNSIPEGLKSLSQWIAWIWQMKDGKWTKPPLNPKTGRFASNKDPGDWTTFEQAVKRYRQDPKLAGIGFVFTQGDPFVGIDLDDCRDPETGDIEPWAMDIIRRFDTYCEISPSQTGVKLWARGNLPGAGHKKGNIEIYDQGRYFTVTGHTLEGFETIRDRDGILKQFYQEFFETPQKKEAAAKNNGRGEGNGHHWNGDIETLPISPEKKRLILDGAPKGERSEAVISVIDALVWANLNDGEIRDIFSRFAIGVKSAEKGASRERWLNSQIEKARAFVANRADRPGGNGNGNLSTNLPPVNEGNAQRLAAKHGADVRYCFPFNRWFVWNERRWQPDETGQIMLLAKSVVRSMYAEAKDFDDKEDRKDFLRHVMACESERALKAMVSLAQSEPGIAVLPAEFDRGPWLLNCSNGTINLRTGELKPHRRGDLITKLAPWEYDPKAECPHWLDHLNKVMNGDQGMINFLQRAFGYSLTGDTSERVLFIEWGSGANGKSLTNDVITTAMGDYATTAPTESLIVKHNEGIPNDIARLAGARFVNVSEAESGKRLAESLVKQLTGGDKITARFLRAEFFEFYPAFKIWLSTNHKPVIRGTDNAIWDRIRLIPFLTRFEGEDKKPKSELIEIFTREMPGILAWLVNGCLDWQREGLNPPEKVMNATGDYRSEMDTVETFLQDCCCLSTSSECAMKTLYARYVEWSAENGDKAMSNKMFGMKLTRKGLDSYRTGKGIKYTGLGLLV